jgi:chromosome segregation ATPase
VKDQSDAPAQTKLQADLEQSLAASESQRTLAVAEIQSLRQAIDKLQSGKDRDAKQIAQLEARSEQDQNAAQSAHEQTRAVKEADDAKNAELIATQGQLRGLETKLADQRRDADGERALAEVSSSSEMRDVIASRNLHIIDEGGEDFVASGFFAGPALGSSVTYTESIAVRTLASLHLKTHRL